MKVPLGITEISCWILRSLGLHSVTMMLLRIGCKIRMNLHPNIISKRINRLTIMN
jgi:hypothetical protein